MIISVSDWLSTALYIVLTLTCGIHSGCYQKQLCCLGHNFTCVAVDDDAIGQLPVKFHHYPQQKLKKGRKGKWHLPIAYSRKMKRTDSLTLRNLIALVNDKKPGVVTNYGHNQSEDNLNKGGEQIEAVKSRSSATILPFLRYQLVFGQPFYPNEQQPETTRYHRRHKLIRYSLLNRHMPLTVKNSRGIDWPSDAIAILENAVYDRVCYCDEKCVTFEDCCSDYSFACPRVFQTSDCIVSQWSAWSNCIPDEGSCKAGVQTRKRIINRKPEHGGIECPSLVEKMSCFKECAQHRRRHQPEVTPVALILDYSYNKTREKFSRSNVLKDATDDRSKSLYYCVIYELGWVNSNCIDKKIGIKLFTGNNICVECQPEAQLHSKTNTCTSDLSDGENGFWKLIGPKSCNGAWKRLFRTDNCRCEINFPTHDAFLFV
uniref:SMB domain-containing protein n=1 Tax=Elaeophora elaphi TaxID=1147741 RepID=A0A0R3S384_9BILA